MLVSNRDKKVIRLMMGAWPWVEILKPEGIEKLLGSNIHIDKSEDCMPIGELLGNGILMR